MEENQFTKIRKVKFSSEHAIFIDIEIIQLLEKLNLSRL